MLLLAGQTGEAWEPSKKQWSCWHQEGIRQKSSHFFLRLEVLNPNSTESHYGNVLGA